MHIVGGVYKLSDAMSRQSLNLFTPSRYRAALSDASNTPPPAGESVRRAEPMDTVSTPSDIDVENATTPQQQRRRRRRRNDSRRTVPLGEDVKSVRILVEGLSPRTTYSVRIISLNGQYNSNSQSSRIEELASVDFSTYSQLDRMRAFAACQTFPHVGRDVCLLIAGFVKMKGGTTPRAPDLVFFDNGPKSFSVKRITFGLKELSLQEADKKKVSKTTSAGSAGRGSPRRAEFDDKENVLHTSGTVRYRGVRGMHTNIIQSSQAGDALDAHSKRTKLKKKKKTSAANEKRSVRRRRRLQRRALNRL